MINEFCEIIDRENLVERYVQGTLHGELLVQFIEHLSVCEEHSQAVTLEKALNRGIHEYARSEIKTKLTQNISRQETTKYHILRYAAVLLVAIIAPILLYYQFSSKPAKQETAQDIKSEQTVELAEKEQTTPGPTGQISELPPETPKVSPKTSARKTLPVAAAQQTKAARRMSGAESNLIRPKGTDFLLNPENDILHEEIQNKLDQFQNRYPECFKKYSAALPGEFTISFRINTSGQTESVAIFPAQIMNSETGNCIIEIITEWHFRKQVSTYDVQKKIVINE